MGRASCSAHHLLQRHQDMKRLAQEHAVTAQRSRRALTPIACTTSSEVALPPHAAQVELTRSGSKGCPLTVASSATGAGLLRAARVKQVTSALLMS